jgi:Flp pilus assembly protein TadB
MATLPPTPSYNPNVPVVTSAGGTTAAYKDPNSPESILRKTTEVQAQTAVDSKYDVNQSAYKQGFRNYRGKWRGSGQRSILISFIILLLVILVVYKTLKFAAKLFVAVLAVILLLVLIGYFTR